MGGLVGQDVGVAVGDAAADLEVTESLAVVAEVGKVAGADAPAIGELGGGEEIAVSLVGVVGVVGVVGGVTGVLGHAVFSSGCVGMAPWPGWAVAWRKRRVSATVR